MFNYSERIKEIRGQKNISAYRLAKDLNVAQTTISKIETGVNIPSLQLLERICEYLSISLSEFFYIEESSSNDSMYSDEHIANMDLDLLIKNYIEMYPENKDLILYQKKELKNQSNLIDSYSKNLQSLEKQKEIFEKQKELFKNTLISQIKNKR